MTEADPAARHVLAAALRAARAARPGSGQGRVVVVGGGPGAVDLLTLRALTALAQADVVVADRLGPVDVLAMLPPDVEVIDVGKTPGHHPVPQHQINALLVEHAQRGRAVVRLKGGDPYVLGRGGEEVAACAAAGIDVEVVPGISSALAVPALAGIPLTQRGVTTAFHVTSGHTCDGVAGLSVDAVACVRDATATLVVLMGVQALRSLGDQLLRAGADPATPVAIVEKGTTPHQRVTRTRLGRAADDAAAVGVEAPAVIVVGAVARDGLLETTDDARSDAVAAHG